MIAETAENLTTGQPGAITRRSARITISDAQAVCKLVARGHSEAGAVALLDKFTLSSWYSWKNRQKNTAKVADILTRTRELRVNTLLSEVERAATGDREAGVRHDWRAADRLLSITTPDRFSDKQQAGTSSAPLMAEAIMDEITKRILESRERKRADAVVECPPAEVKQIQ